MRYDADTAPDPEAWLALEEQERLDLAVKYHRKNRLPMGQNPKMHGVAHVIVENQVASGDATAVPATLERLMREGLDRHDAIPQSTFGMMATGAGHARNDRGQE